MQLDETSVTILGQLDGIQRTFAAALRTPILHILALTVTQRSGILQGQRAAQQPAAETTDAESRWFFRGKDD